MPLRELGFKNRLDLKLIKSKMGENAQEENTIYTWILKAKEHELSYFYVDPTQP